jgi:hypothetical protein
MDGPNSENYLCFANAGHFPWTTQETTVLTLSNANTSVFGGIRGPKTPRHPVLPILEHTTT